MDGKEEETKIKLIGDMIDKIAKYEFDIIEPTINRLFSQSSCEFIDPSHSDYMCKLYEPDSYRTYKTRESGNSDDQGRSLCRAHKQSTGT